MFIDVIREKRCVTRHYLIEHVAEVVSDEKKAANIVDDTIEALLKRGVIVRKGRGLYCWAGPP